MYDGDNNEEGPLVVTVVGDGVVAPNKSGSPPNSPVKFDLPEGTLIQSDT